MTTRNKITTRITSAHALAFVAIFIALSGGGAYAAVTAAKNSVVSKSVKDSSLRGKDIRDDSLTGRDVAEGSLGRVPTAGSAQTANSAKSADSAAAVAPGAVTGGGIADNSLTGTDIDESKLGVPTAGLEYVVASSPSDSSSPKSVTLDCPVGKQAVFGGYDIGLGKTGAPPNQYSDVVMDEFLPSADGRSIVATAFEEEPHAGNWQFSVRAACVSVG